MYDVHLSISFNVVYCIVTAHIYSNFNLRMLNLFETTPY